MDCNALLTAVMGCLLVTVNATVDLSCQVQRTISQPVTGGQCLDNSALRLCTSEGIMCSCLGQGTLLEWRNSLFTDLVSFPNSGSSMTGTEDSDSATGATAVVTAVNPFDNITTVLTLNVTTTATVSADQFNNTAIGCLDSSGLSGEMERTIFLFAPPPAPSIMTPLNFTAGASFTVGWSETLRGCEMVDRFDPQISPNDLSCTMSGMAYTCSYNETHLGQMYTFTVSALNCGTQTSQEASVPLNLTAPSQPTLTATPLYDSSRRLLGIESLASVVTPVFIADGVDGSPTEYIFTYDSGSESLHFTQLCTGTSCQHMFNVTNSSQVQQYTVSVAVRNIVGVGTASAPVMIDSTNNVFDVIVESDIGVLGVICQFQSGPVTSASCSIKFGADPTYLNLPNTASSTGTNVTHVTIPFGGSLQRDTLYYYVVSTMEVQMQGTFHSSCTHEDLGDEDLGDVDATPDERCTGQQNSAQFTGGVVCYGGVAPGSVAVYICNSTHHLEGSRFRRCQSNGNWSGRNPQCVEEVVMSTSVGLGASTVVGVSIAIFLLSFTSGALLAAVICGLRWRGKSSGQTHTSPADGVQPTPVYDVVEEHPVDMLELKENIAYGPVVKENIAYGPVGH